MNSLLVTLSLVMKLITRRLFCRLLSLAMVIIFSASERTSLARVAVVSILPFSRKKVTKPRSMAVRWAVLLPSFLVPGIDIHSYP